MYAGFTCVQLWKGECLCVICVLLKCCPVYLLCACVKLYLYISLLGVKRRKLLYSITRGKRIKIEKKEFFILMKLISKTFLNNCTSHFGSLSLEMSPSESIRQSWDPSSFLK